MRISEGLFGNRLSTLSTRRRLSLFTALAGLAGAIAASTLNVHFVHGATRAASGGGSNLPPSAYMQITHYQKQSWNNCGPATLSMLLSHFGHTETQEDIAAVIKPFDDDKNVTPSELVEYASTRGYGARLIEGGDVTLLKTLVANNMPVIVETWVDEPGGNDIGHFQLIVGYAGDVLRISDPYYGPDLEESEIAFDTRWKVFNRHFVVVWPRESEKRVKSILGARWNDASAVRTALATAQAEVNANPNDAHARFNLGTNHVLLGDSAAAVQAYDKARALGLHARTLWYQYGEYEAHFEQGDYTKVVDLATETLRAGSGLEESHYWRGKAYAALGDVKAAELDFNRALRYNVNYQAARQELDALGKSQSASN